MVTFAGGVRVSLLSATRNASISVTSARSKLVTCGMVSQLRLRLAPEIVWIRDRGSRRTGPKFSYFTSGQGGRPAPIPEDGAGA